MALRLLLRASLIIAVTLAAILSTLGPSLSVARADQAPPPARLFALRASSFPPHAAIRGSRVGADVAVGATRLSTQPFDQLGWVESYIQTAWWSQGRSHPMSLQYEASLFGSTDGAAAAYGDARASLWELASPAAGRVGRSPTMVVTERDGHIDAFVVLTQGPILLELRLRYVRPVNRRSVDTALWYLRHAAAAALARAGQVAATLPATTAPWVAVEPSIYLAPWGTGPVVKSPSLMAPATATAGTQLDGGAYRPVAGSPLASRAAPGGRVLPSGGLTRYAVTASSGSATGWYDAVTLYSSTQLAEAAFGTLTATNRRAGSLEAYTLDPQIWNVGHLSILAALAAWQLPRESIYAFRVQNVILSIAASGRGPFEIASLLTRQVATMPTWLHTQGTQIVDAANQPARLSCLNWYGADQNDFVVGGLDFRPYQDILADIDRLGYTCIRLPFSNQMVEQNPAISAHVGKNPDLAGLHALDILDRIVGYAGALGLSVVLDDHRSDAGWSAEENGLWYTAAYPDSAFQQDWVTLARRYAVNDVVVGADLRNEPHGPATWGDGNPATDWMAAAERAGNGVLAVNPHLLIMVEGVQFYGGTGSYWWGGNLAGVASSPVALHFADGSAARSQLVYSIHDYGPDNCGTGCAWFNAGTTYGSLAQLWEQYWGFITDDPSKSYAAPVWVGEFGTCNYQVTCVSNTAPGSQGQWFSSLVHYIGIKHLNWAYWSVNGTQSTAGARVYGALDWYGLFDKTWTTPYMPLDNALQSIAAAGDGSTSPPTQP